MKRLLLIVGKKDKRRRFAIFLVTVAPILLIGVLAYFKSYQNLTELTLAGRQSVAELAAAVLDERFDRLTDLGTSLATRERVRQSVSQGKWDEAIEFLTGVRNENPMIERIFLSDPSGTLMADTPALPGDRKKNFSSRDWYRGVSKSWKPYVSDVYQRAAAPQYNVIAVAIPIKAEKEKAVGILVLQLRVEALVDWSKSVAVGASGFVFFVDKKGHLAAHPKIPLEREVVDYSSVPVVQKVLRGKSGVEINFNARELVAPFQPEQPVVPRKT